MWYYKDKVLIDLIEGFESFVYIIERLNIIEDSTSPIFYIGKKTFYSRRKIKGKTVISESDWKDYYGSSKWLNNDVMRYGKHNFKRSILHFCRTKGDAGYLEIKEQIDRKVLYVDEDGYKLYYNGNINGRYHSHPDSFILDEDLRVYFLSKFASGNNKGKRWVNNGNINKILNTSEAEKIIGTNNWVYGKIPPKIKVNNGSENLYIENIDEIDKYNIGHLSKRVTDGENNKLIPIHELDDFLNNNPSWKIGFSGNKNMCWITNGSEDIKINVSDIDKYPTYTLGRNNIAVKGKISVFKDDEYIWINKNDLENYQENGWTIGGKPKDYNAFFVTNDIEQKWFKTESEQEKFLLENVYWRKGQLKRELLTTNNKVFAINMITNEKVCVNKDVYNNNDMLTSIKTKKVKVKKGNKIIFEGYTTMFSLKFDNIPLRFIKASANSGGKLIVVKKGKYKHLTDMKYSAKYI